MTRLRHETGEAGISRKRLKSLASLLAAFSLLVAQSQAVLADIANTATATANYQGSTVTSAPATASIPVAPAAPSFTIAKTVDTASLSAPGTLTYTIQVSNTGNVSLTAPSLTDALAQGATALTLTSGPDLVSGDAGTKGTLDAGEIWTYTATYAVTQAEIDNTADIVNTATFDTAESEPSSASAATTLSSTPALTLTKTGTLNDGGDGIVNAGDTIDYTFSISNTGNVTLTNVMVSDPGATIAGEPITSLAPGATDTTNFTGVYTLTQADIDAGGYANTATVAGTPPTGSDVTGTSSTTTSFAGPAAIAIVKDSRFIDANGDGFAQAGETIQYTFGVRNAGLVTLNNVSVSDPLVTVTGGPIASLAPGAEDTMTFAGTYTLTAADIVASRVTNSATATGTPPSGPAVSDVSDSMHPADGSNPGSYGTGSGSDDPTIQPLLRPGIQANNDNATGIDGATGQPNVLNIFSNDTLNGVAVVSSDVTLTVDPGTPVPPQLAFDSVTGSVSVDPGTLGGVYSFNYTICETINPDNCDAATVSITVVSPIIANDDAATNINGVTGQANVLNVYGNDALNGAAVNQADITLTIDTPVPSGLSFDPVTGQVSVDPGTPGGAYTFNYTICEQASPANCDAAVVTIDVTVNASVAGIVFLDLNSNGVFDGDPPAGAGYLVELLDTSGTVVGTAVTDTDGRYMINAPSGAGYKIVFKKSNGRIVGEIDNITLTGGQTLIDQNLPVDPAGVIYNSVTRQPVAGVTVAITDATGDPLPAICLLDPAQQSQITGADGAYNFDIVPGADTACPAGESEYGLRVTTPLGYVPGISTRIPAQSGALDASACPIDAVPGGSCQVAASNAPPSTGNGVYYLRFLIGAGDPDVINNHLPIDPVIVSVPSFTKTAVIADVRRGERVPYRIEATSVFFAPARIDDIMPPGFAYVRGSARINGVAIQPAVNGRTLTFDGLAPDGARSIRLDLLLVATAQVATGTHVNRAQFIDPPSGTVLATAQASVEVVPEHVFDCGEVIGRVFDDKNRNGYQDEGEEGLPGVRVATVKGLLVTTDKFGRFHVACADLPDAAIGSNFLMKLDTRTLPTGYRLTTENPRDVRLTRGKITKLNFGAAITRVVRLDLKDAAFEPGSTKLKPKWGSGIDKLIAVLDKEPSALRLTYYTAGDKAAATKRLAMVEKFIADRWRKRAGRYELPIETRIIGKK
jgi:uncharacterized repeat protein (TIGR01451 family)